jgi:hypothetical protein
LSSRAVHGLVAVGAAVLGVLWLMGIVDLPPCPLATFFSVLCPMCGSTRAVEAAASGNIALAFTLNPLFPFWSGVVGLVILDLLWAVRYGPKIHGPCRRLMNGIQRRRWAIGLVGSAWVAVILYLNLFMREILLHP